MKSERGSLAPLGIGLFTITLALMLVIISASSLFVFQKRLTSFSESAALFIASTGEPIQNFRELSGDYALNGLEAAASVAVDDRTVEVVSCAMWKAPIAIVTSLAQSKICSHAAARAE